MPSRAAVQRIAFAICILVAGAPSRAEQNYRRTPQGPEEQIVAAKDYPWSAIGKLNNGTFGACTAVLISQSYALTAAHCVFFRQLGRFLPAESLHFILGYEDHRFADHLRVLAYYIPPTYDPLRPFETITSDWALLQVSDGVRSAVRPLTIAQGVEPVSELNLMTAGYSSRTPYRMTADQGCRFVGRSSDKVLLFDTCYAPEGFSGGPILVKNPDGRSYSTAGIHVGNQAWQGRSVAIAVSAEAIWREIRPCIEEQECHFQHFANGRDPTAAEILAGLPNLGLRRIVDYLSDSPCSSNGASCGTAYAGR